VDDAAGRELTGKVVYRGPKVDRSIVALLDLYSDPRWATGQVPAATRAEVDKGPDPIVEACILQGDKVRAKLQTNLAYAWDEATRDEKIVKTLAAKLRLMAGDGGADEDGGNGDGGSDGGEGAGSGGSAAEGPPARLSESDPIRSQQQYGELCVQELGEIPFFPKVADGKYGTFDCRDLLATVEGRQVPVAGVEGAEIPLFQDGRRVTTCETPLTPSMSEYNCNAKCDTGMYLEPGACQPGPMVVTAKNDKGSLWLLLCRKVSDDGAGMQKTKHFNDIAMIGHNPRTGRTCFFQNAIDSKVNGAKVTHPADRERSAEIWSTNIQAYCTGECHAADPFVHSPWIDGAKRRNGTPIVPRMGQQGSGMLISYLEAPYNIVGADSVRPRPFELPKQLVSEEVSACANCHRLAGFTAGRFAEWSTGEGNEYFQKITDYGKEYPRSHWMPEKDLPATKAAYDSSEFAKAMAHIKACNRNPSDPACEWADVPRGRFDNPRIRP
jgi:hypothetical protein